MFTFLLFFLQILNIILSDSDIEPVQSVIINADGTINTEAAKTYIPQFRTVEGPPPQQYWVKFINLANEPIELYYDDGRDGILQGVMQDTGDSLNIGTYVGHQFYYRRPGKLKRLFITTMETGKTEVPYKDEERMTYDEQSIAYLKQKFIREYKERTGIDWLHTFPRPKPILKFLPFSEIGEIIKMESKYGYYTCYPVTLSKNDINNCLEPNQNLKLEWKVLSLKPKILELKNFLSDYEVEHIKHLAVPKLERSVTGAGGFENSARTSSTAWVRRNESDLLDHLFKRIADVTLVDERHLWDTIGSESIQVVYYEKGQEYKAHHDWRVNRVQTRFATFLMYLNDQIDEDSGGETYFPKVDIKVHPGKGSVVMFYDLMEDGNVDDLTLHAALPVKKGVKWLSNVWIWDPNFS